MHVKDKGEEVVKAAAEPLDRVQNLDKTEISRWKTCSNVSILYNNDNERKKHQLLVEKCTLL